MSLTKDKYKNAFLKAVDPLAVEEHLQALSDLPDKFPDWARLYGHSIIGTGEFRIDIPHDPAKLAELENLLGEAWAHTHQGKTYHENCEHYYAHPSGCVLNIIMDAAFEGSVVELAKAGEKVSDIYEVSGTEEDAC